MGQDLKDAVADLNADKALLDKPNLPNDQLFKTIDKLFKRDSQLVKRATQTLTRSLSQLKAEREQLQQQLRAERKQLQPGLAHWAYNILAGILAWGQATELVELDGQIKRLERLLSTRDIR
jgi:hypothetical protein